MTAAQYGNVPPNPAGQYNGLLGGNPNLTPESRTRFRSASCSVRTWAT